MSSWIRKIKEFPRADLSLLALMSVIFFFITYVYNLLRPLKIALIISTENGGAEIIPFLKVWGIVPAALFFTYVCNKLSKYYSRPKVIFLMLLVFLTYIILFMFLYPYRNEIQLVTLSDWMNNFLPNGFHFFSMMFRYWYLSLFYICAELWASVILSTLYWGFVNESIPMEKAKHYYGYLVFGANLGAVAAGATGKLFSASEFSELIPYGETGWDQGVFKTLLVSAFSILAVIILFHKLAHSLPKAQEIKQEKSRKYYSLKECFSILLESKYLMSIAIIVIAYNLVFNLTDVVWTDQLRSLYGVQGKMINGYISQITMLKGTVAIILSLFFTSRIIERFGWLTAALITPAIICVTSISFFPIIVFEPALTKMFLAETLLTVIVFVGAIQSCLTRACKYTVFDVTKEMAYIPLSLDSLRKGKAAIDGVVSRVGKSGGSIIFQVLFLVYPTLAASVPVISVIVFFLIIVWIKAAITLDKEMKKLEVVN